MGFKRKQSRIDVSRNGRLQRGSLSATCKVLDLSESGVRVESRLFVKSGETLHLHVELDGGRSLSCMIQPIYVRSPRFGARIVFISPENLELLNRLLDDRVQRQFSTR